MFRTILKLPEPVLHHLVHHGAHRAHQVQHSTEHAASLPINENILFIKTDCFILESKNLNRNAVQLFHIDSKNGCKLLYA